MVGEVKVKPRPTVPLARDKQLYFRRLNNVRLVEMVTRDALEAYSRQEKMHILPRQGDAARRFHFVVPSAGKPTARISRDGKAIPRLLSEVREEGEFRKSLVLAVSITKDYQRNVMRLVLRAHPERLMGWEKGGPALTLPLVDLISRGRHKVLEEQIRLRLEAILYARPRDYLDRLKRIVKVDVPIVIFEQFAEVKATRDVVVHAENVANDRYVGKAGSYARARSREALVVDSVYFDQALTILKRLIGGIHDDLCARRPLKIAIFASL
ncbi:hypothetical protein ASF41_12475 [Methylobacterium sp. Leaf111]|uniref:hypothetical protein n=1 Tax=Methylobacterium sp. Leaf111 TaxID=1736257 RepID=UPI0006FB90CA|nr:hypothetical protein [Methylobacterium sp. Leaf111]KQP52462.1 hypothetical protein ASF41_12475 [Methylobacterium sp. Leaf111]